MQTPTSILLSDYIKFTKDKTAENIAMGKQRMDYHYTFLLSEANNYVVERTKYSKLKKDQRSFLLPPDYIKIKRVRVKIGGKWYRLNPILNLDTWADETEQDISSTIPIDYTIINEQGNMHIELSDMPDADYDTVNFEIIYEGYQDPLLFPGAYSIGTVTIEQGEATVTGSNDTAWTEDMAGRFIKVNNGKFYYEIANVGGIHAIALINYFQEVNVTNVTYVIDEIPRLPHEYHKTPLWGAVEEYYLPNNAKKAADFGKLYARDLLMLQNKYQSKTKGRVSPGIRVGSSRPYVPRNYPNSALRRI